MKGKPQMEPTTEVTVRISRTYDVNMVVLVTDTDDQILEAADSILDEDRCLVDEQREILR